jgi:hypothetical protein
MRYEAAVTSSTISHSASPRFAALRANAAWTVVLAAAFK